MRITTVTYSHLANLGNYENERVEATALVLLSQKPEDVLSELKDWVHAQTHSQEKYQKLLTKYYQKKDELQEIETRLQKVKEQWNQTAEFLRAQGLKPDAPEFPIALSLPPAPPKIEEVDADLDNTPF